MEYLRGYTQPAASPLSEEEKRDAMSEVFGSEFADKFNDPVVFSRRRFWTHGAIQFFKRDFALVSRTLHLSSVYRRRREYSEQVLDNFWTLTTRKIADIERILCLNRDRLLKLCEQSQLKEEETADFLHPADRVVPVIAPAARSYSQVLGVLDQIYFRTGAAFMAGIIDDKQKLTAEMAAKKAVRAFASMLRMESIRLRKEARRVDEAGASLGTPVDPAQIAAERAHDQAAEEFDLQVEQDKKRDPNDHVDGETAADLISDLATTATAAEAASGKRRTSKPKPAPASEPAAAGAAAS